MPNGAAESRPTSETAQDLRGKANNVPEPTLSDKGKNAVIPTQRLLDSIGHLLAKRLATLTNPITPAMGLLPCLVPSVSYYQRGLWQNTSKTLPASADSHIVRVATCPYTGIDIVFSSDAASPILRYGSNGFWWVEGKVSTNGDAPAVANRQSFSAAFATRSPQPTITQVLLDGDSPFLGYQQSTTWRIYTGGIHDSTLTIPTTDVIHGIYSTASEVTYRSAGVAVTQAALPSATTSTLAYLYFTAAPGSFGWSGRVYGIVPSTGTRTSDDVFALEGFLAQLIPPLDVPVVVFDGNSIPAGFGGTPGNEYPTMVGSNLRSGWEYHNYGVSGQRLYDMILDADLQIDPNYNLSRPKNVLVVEGGSNDISQGASLATVKSRASDYFAARAGVGWFQIMTPVLDRVDFSGGQRTIKNDFNTWLATRAGIEFDDLLTLPVQLAGDSPWATYPTAWNPDLIHPSDVGNVAMASAITPRVRLA